MKSEEEFIHDLANELSKVYAKISKMAYKSDNYSKDELVQLAKDAETIIENSFDLVDERKKTIITEG